MTRRAVRLAASFTLVAHAAHAVSIERTVTNDTFITQNAALGGPAVRHDGVDTLWAGGGPDTLSYPLASFDLRAYRGATVTGTAHFRLWLQGGAPAGDGAPRDVGIYRVAVPWDRSATYDNFGGFPGVNFAADVGPLLATQAGVTWPGTGARFVTWDVSASVVQSWIDAPATNYGLLVRNFNAAADRDLIFSSQYGAQAPRLTFDLAARAGDYDNDGAIEPSDVDLLLRQTPGGVPPGDPRFDLNADGAIVTAINAPGSDVDVWVRSVARTNYGDTDLDGRINFNDLLAVAKNYDDPNRGWQGGDFDGNDVVNFDDLLLLVQNYGQVFIDTAALPAGFAADVALAQSLVPEPTTLALILVAAGGRRRPGLRPASPVTR